MKLEQIPVPDAFEHDGVKFIFRALPERVKSLNELPVMCLSVVIYDEIPGIATQTDFRLYVSIQRSDEMRNREVEDEVLEQRDNEAAGLLVAHLQKFYGISMSVLAEPPVGADSDEYTIATLLGEIYDGLNIVETSHSGDKLTVYYDPVEHLRGLVARVSGTGRWSITTYTKEQPEPTAMFYIQGQIRIGDSARPQQFILTNNMHIQALMPEELISHWLSEDVIVNTLNKMFRHLYEFNEPIANDAHFTSTFVSLPSAEERVIDRRDYEL